jgi:hypothetical protein
MTELIDDLIVLGLAAPQHLMNGRTTVCMGGWSPSRGFIRIYPAKVDMGLHRWDVIQVQVEKNDQDTRLESWKIVGSKEEWDNLHLKVEVVNHIKDAYERREIVVNNLSPCVNYLNQQHFSLGFVHASKIKKEYFDTNPQYGKQIQLALLTTHAQGWAKVKRDYKEEPRMRYVCSNCEAKQGYHDQVVLEWGWYEWMRKNPNNLDQVFKNALLDSDQHEICLLVGNQENQRTSYMVIAVLPIQTSPMSPKPKQLPLF